MKFEKGFELNNEENIDFEEAVYALIEDKRKALLLGTQEVKEIENEIADIENDNDAKRLYQKIKNRLNYLTSPFADYDNSESVFGNNINLETKERTKRKIERIISMCKDGKLDSIGKGFTAEVFQSKICPKCCYKVIQDLEEYKKGCTIKEEALIQDSLSDLGIEGVNVPKPYYYRMSPESHVMVMETLDACTIKNILEGREALPENFNLEKSINNLKVFITEMHSMGIHHRDLHDKNVLIDRNTGELAVIDFGKAKAGCDKNLERAYRHEDEIYIEEKNGEVVRFKPTDLDYIEMHYQKLKKLLYSKE